jgi:signal transduction histidine kinase
MLLVGLTGGIGSGKSTVAAMLREKGATVVDADEVARAVVERVCDANRAARVRLTVDGEVRGAWDRARIEGVLENLVGNAVDSVSGQADGAVTVSTERVEEASGAGRVRIVVADTGPGMSRSELDRAFEDFHTTKAGGTGLGLSIVRRLVLDLGGSLRIETAPGSGTRAILELPLGKPGTDGRKPA